MGRPPIGKGILVGVRVRPEDIEVLDWHIANNFHLNGGGAVRGLKPMTRPQAIREMIKLSLDRARKERDEAAAKTARASARKAKR